MTFRIDERFQQITAPAAALPRRPEFRDPVISALQGVRLSHVIDVEFDRFHNPAGGPIDVISRVFRRLRGA
jgi:hypothetical protein